MGSNISGTHMAVPSTWSQYDSFFQENWVQLINKYLRLIQYGCSSCVAAEASEYSLEEDESSEVEVIYSPNSTQVMKIPS